MLIRGHCDVLELLASIYLGRGRHQRTDVQGLKLWLLGCFNVVYWTDASFLSGPLTAFQPPPRPGMWGFPDGLRAMASGKARVDCVFASG